MSEPQLRPVRALKGDRDFDCNFIPWVCPTCLFMLFYASQPSQKSGKNCHHRPVVPKVRVAKDQEMWIRAEAIQTSELIADIEKEYSKLLLKSSMQSFFYY